jgi:multimeric flavodoxin WrbA
MELLILQASPHKTGNTATMMESFTNVLTRTADVRIHRFDLNDLRISPCRGCFSCSGGRCVIDDDMQTIYPKFETADVIVFATPVFWWHMAAQMKLLIDRMTALLGPDDSIPVLHGKHVVLCITYKHRQTAEAAMNMFKDFIEWAKIKLDIVEYCSMDGHVADCPEKLNEVRKLAEKICKEGIV